MYGEVAFNGIQFGEHANLHVKEGDFWFGVHGHLRYAIGVNTDYEAGLLELEHEDCCYGEEAERCKSESLFSPLSVIGLPNIKRRTCKRNAYGS